MKVDILRLLNNIEFLEDNQGFFKFKFQTTKKIFSVYFVLLSISVLSLNFFMASDSQFVTMLLIPIIISSYLSIEFFDYSSRREIKNYKNNESYLRKNMSENEVVYFKTHFPSIIDKNLNNFKELMRDKKLVLKKELSSMENLPHIEEFLSLNDDISIGKLRLLNDSVSQINRKKREVIEEREKIKKERERLKRNLTQLGS